MSPRLDQIQQRLRDLMKRDGITWHEHPDDASRGMWVRAGWVPDWVRGYAVYPMEGVK